LDGGLDAKTNKDTRQRRPRFTEKKGLYEKKGLQVLPGSKPGDRLQRPETFKILYYRAWKDNAEKDDRDMRKTPEKAERTHKDGKAYSVLTVYDTFKIRGALV
jgi:hypothetical protein